MPSGRLLVLLAALGSGACALPVGGQGDAQGVGEKTGQVSSAIMGGTPAYNYPEAALVDMLDNGQQFAACSGVVVAPYVVMTAGHCIGSATDWNITAPYASGQTAHATLGAVYDYYPPAGTETVDPNFHDVGLVFLDRAIGLAQYPVVAAQPLPSGGEVVNIGRIQNGNFSSTDLFVGPPVAVSDATPVGYPYDYQAPDIIESGDSGGPAETVAGGVVVAVNSGGGGGQYEDIEVLARVDLLYGWIQQQIQANGGGGNDAGITPDFAGSDDAGIQGQDDFEETDGGVDAGQEVYGEQGSSGSGPSANQATSGGRSNAQGGYGCSVSLAPSAPGRPSSPVLLLIGLALLRLGRTARTCRRCSRGDRRTCCRCRR
jgi:Trypsin